MAAAPAVLGFLGGSTGTGELLLLFAVILVLFGPRRLPEMARLVGRALHELRRAAQDFRDQVMLIDPPTRPPTAPVVPRPITPAALPRGRAEDVADAVLPGAEPAPAPGPSLAPPS